MCAASRVVGLVVSLLRRALVLGAMVGVQALVSIGLMTYIHQTQIIKGEYGTTWRAQQPGFVKPGTPSR